MTLSVKEELAQEAARVETWLAGCLAGRKIPPRLREAMDYSLAAGGKRLRPVLCLIFTELCGGRVEAAMPFACAFELIHTYSLIHDDLPAMDDDDLRRGKPSNHKVFGEATAILAGDGLLTEAFTCMFESAREIPAGRVLDAARLLAVAAGAGGMVGGQALDMEYTGAADIELSQLSGMHAMKTGALIRAACESGAVLAGADEERRILARDFGIHLGAAFQIVDDILDVVGDEKALGKPVGSDEAQGKHTYPSLVGLDRSRCLAEERVAAALSCLETFHGPRADFLRRLTRYIVERVQ
ncbi:Polyprenyl synthetase [Desulfovibrio sp. X2]|uniref:polyprenyl synthetase family protein n=1 Tax=Desulfovibrio sp. X2 TaxID=941449 RepID=UPI000358972F|nr:farnesyl diphosphate synthase [Desulfovibrio sp. X2]EPR37524.1 Polyprenyl synthetase [Desulfovibrio sp. X2]